MVALGFGGIGNVGAAGGTDQHPAIPYLAATLAIKGRAIQNGDALFTGLQGVNRIAVLDQGGNGCRALGTLVTGKDRLAWNTDRLVVIDLEAAAFLGSSTLFSHRPFITLEVQGQSPLPGNVVGQIHWKAVGIVEPENQLTGQQCAIQSREGLFQDGHAVIQCPGELFFLGRQNVGYPGLVVAQVGKGIPHLLHQGTHQAGEKRFRCTQLVAVPDRPTDDAAQYIAPPLIARHHAVGNQKGTGSEVVRYDPQGFVLQISHSKALGR